MLKRLLVLLIAITVCGCSSVKIPKYITDENPYKKRYYFAYEDVYNATMDVLAKSGWVVSNTTDPRIYERNKDIEGNSDKQILIFTEMKATPLVVGTRYARLNAYLRAAPKETTEVEIRYVTVTSVPFKSFYDYERTGLVEKLLADIEQQLSQ